MSAKSQSPNTIILALLRLVVMLLEWSVAVLLVGTVVGSLCALFLCALDMVTAARFTHPWLLFGLPLAGFGIAFVYLKIGGAAEGGNNLIVDRIHEPGGGVPLRLAPLILISTVATHLFGGSAGREGTAVQLGGSIAGGVARLLRMRAEGTRTLLMAGVAAGFGAVFGTPVAGAVFAMEVLTIGRVQYHALIPCLIAAIVGDWVCHGWGIGHIVYAVGYLADVAGPHIDVVLMLKVALAGVIFGLVARAFSSLSHETARLFKTLLPYSPLRALVGGFLVIGLVYATGTREYLGLGVWSPNAGDVTLLRFFDPALTYTWSWAWKILFTVVTLSTGFKGGEVTPLFFIGAALGHALATLLGAPVDLFAGLGFVAVFAGAANTPLACVILGIELFGATHTVYLAVACFLAYLCSGHSGIYLSQRMGVSKTFEGTVQHGVTLRHWLVQNPSPAERLIRYAANRRNAPIPTPIKEGEPE